MNVAVVIPALNESGSIAAVLLDIPSHVRVVVVDNGSTDDTAQIAASHGATVLSEPRRGYGTAVLTGMRHLAADPPDVLVVLDADHADHPERMTDLIDPIRRDVADLVQSERTSTAEAGALSTVQIFGNGLATALIHRVTGRRYRDMGPFRAIRWTSLMDLEMEDPTWGWNVEMQMKAVNRGLRVLEIPLPYRKRRAGRSKISGSLRGSARAGVRILQAVYRYR